MNFLTLISSILSIIFIVVGVVAMLSVPFILFRRWGKKCAGNDIAKLKVKE
jgi:hypothetical protein